MLRLIPTDLRRALRVRRYWRSQGRQHLPCAWCVHEDDPSICDEPMWMWCSRPSRPTLDRWGNAHRLGCNWGNE